MPYQSGFRPGLFAGQTIFIPGGGGGLGRCIDILSLPGKGLRIPYSLIREPGFKK